MGNDPSVGRIRTYPYQVRGLRHPLAQSCLQQVACRVMQVEGPHKGNHTDPGIAREHCLGHSGL